LRIDQRNLNVEADDQDDKENHIASLNII